MAQKGGKKAHEKGKAHKYTSEEAKKHSMKGVAARRRNAVLRAAKVLIDAGFKPEELVHLEDQEFIRYAREPEKLVADLQRLPDTVPVRTDGVPE